MVAESSPKLLITEIQSPFFSCVDLPMEALQTSYLLILLSPAPFSRAGRPDSRSRGSGFGLTLPQGSSLGHRGIVSRSILGGREADSPRPCYHPAVLPAPLVTLPGVQKPCRVCSGRLWLRAGQGEEATLDLPSCRQRRFPTVRPRVG